MHIATIIIGSIKVFIRSFFVLGFLQWFNFWLIAHRECEVKIDTIRMFIRGGRFHRKVVDMFVAIYCIIDREYFPKGFEIKSTDTVVDIGGHIGSFTLAAAREAREGKVYTFEPDALNFGMLKKNIELNRFSNVTLVNQAIGARTEERVFYRNELNDSSSSFTRVVGAGFTIRTSSLADAFATNRIERCDFMKMDCEGSEYEIMFSTPDEVFSKIMKIAIEVHDARYFNLSPEMNNEEALLKRLHVLGYKTRVVKETTLHDLVFAWRE